MSACVPSTNIELCRQFILIYMSCLPYYATTFDLFEFLCLFFCLFLYYCTLIIHAVVALPLYGVLIASNPQAEVTVIAVVGFIYLRACVWVLAQKPLQAHMSVCVCVGCCSYCLVTSNALVIAKFCSYFPFCTPQAPTFVCGTRKGGGY